MFDRFIRLTRAKKALRERRFEDALQLALDPLIASDRRADDLRRVAGQELVARGRVRLAAGDTAAAKADAERVRAGLGHEVVAELLAEIEAAVLAGEAALQVRRQALLEAKLAIDAGDLAKAEALLAAPSGTPPSAEVRQAQTALVDRRRQAAAIAAQAAQSLATGTVAAACEHLARAELLDRDHPQVIVVRAQLAAAGATVFSQSLRDWVGQGDLATALSSYRLATSAQPTLRTSPMLRDATEVLAKAVLAHLAAESSLSSASQFARNVRAADLPLPECSAALVDALLSCDGGSLSQRGLASAGAEPLSALAAAATAAGAKHLAQLATQAARGAVVDGERLAAARGLVDRGDLDGARARLLEILVDQPLHDGARRELAVLDQSLADLDRRLGEVRAAMRAGRLRQACSLAMGLVGSSRLATESHQALLEARARMALVDRGLDEVRSALHGRAAATQEGVRHCLLRLEELAKVQVDHEDLPRVVDAVTAEIEALGICARASLALERGAAAEVLTGLTELLAMRPRLLAPERLAARLCDLADRLARSTDVALTSGRFTEVERCAVQFEQLGVVRAEFVTRANEWRVAMDAKKQACGEKVLAARARLAERDLAEAERLGDEARQLWLESGDAKSLINELRQLRHQTDVLATVENLAGERDFQGAHEKLAAMPATSPFLRTRIYDMKQNLAKAQGLEGAFLLRVDEGGEQLVLRGETVTIGNVRQMRADLPVLANLAGRHASIRRSMSFHGGMQDTIVAEEGEVSVAGRKVETHPLKPGDRVQLGPALGFLYQRPATRSLTVGIVLQSGFQVAGTDRILLMKDRGRDGRILMGAGNDVHVRVMRATAEVEVFATSSGQMRVACAQGGTIDGVPFQGEHPLAAGQRIEAGGISFQLLPWRPAA